MEGSSECDVLGVLPTPQPHVSVEYEPRSAMGLVWKRCRNERYLLSPAGYQTAISRLPRQYCNRYSDWAIRSITWVYFWIECFCCFHTLYTRKLISANCMVWILSIICALYQILCPLPGFIRSSLTDIIWVALAKATLGWEGKKFPSSKRLMMSNLFKNNWQSELWDWNC